MILKSPAKLNLYLEVINKRKDGFHNISTVFEKIADIKQRKKFQILIAYDEHKTPFKFLELNRASQQTRKLLSIPINLALGYLAAQKAKSLPSPQPKS